MGVDAIVEIGPRTNLRRMLQRGSAPYLTMEAMQPQMAGYVPNPYQPVIDKISHTYLASGDLYYNETLHGYTLAPIFGWDDMALDDWTVTGTTPQLAYPPNGLSNLQTGNPVAYLQLGDVSSTVDATATSKFSIPACSCWVFTLNRWVAPEGTTLADITYRLDFGEVYRLEWGSATPPILSLKGGDGSYTELKRGRVADSEWASYIAEVKQNWQFYVLGSDLYIITDVLQYPMVVRNIGVNGWGSLAAAPVTFTVHGLPVMINVTKLRFAPAGYFETVVNHVQPYADPDPGGAYPQPVNLHPYPNNVTVGCTLNGKVVGSADSRKRYRVELHGNTADSPYGSSYATRTPLVQAFQPTCNPLYSPEEEKTDIWLPLTDYLQSGQVTLTRDPSANEFRGSLLLEQTRGAEAWTVREYLAAHQVAIGVDPDLQTPYCLRVRVREVGSEDDYATVFTGFGLVLADSLQPLRTSVELVGYSQAVKLARKLLDAPCGIDLAPEDAITRWMSFVGLCPDDVTADATGLTLDNPERNYQSPPWLPNEGSRAVEMVRLALDRKGMILVEHGDGTFRIAAAPDYIPALTIATDDSDTGDTAVTVARTAGSQWSKLDAANFIRYRGHDMDGIAYLEHRWDLYSIAVSAHEYSLGEPVCDVVDLPDTVSRPQLVLDANKLYNRRHTGRPELTASALAGFVQLRPHQTVTLINTRFAPSPGRNLLIDKVTLPLNLYTNQPCTLALIALNPEQVAEVQLPTNWL